MKMSAISRDFNTSNGSNDTSHSMMASENNGDPLDTDFVPVKAEPRMDRAPPR
jgi:hypothetical protein